jgi:hypothetical protein
MDEQYESERDDPRDDEAREAYREDEQDDRERFEVD